MNIPMLSLYESLQNLQLWSQEYTNIKYTSNATVQDNASTSPRGLAEGGRVTDTSNSVTEGIGQVNWGTYPAKMYTFSLYIQKDWIGRATRFPALRLRCYLTGGEDQYGYLYFDTLTGEYELDGDASYGGVEDYGSHWRVWVTVVTSIVLDLVQPGFYPAWGKGEDFTADATVMNSCSLWGWQTNEGIGPTPHIITTDAMELDLGEKLDLDIATSIKDQKTNIVSSHRTHDKMYRYLWGSYGKVYIALEYLSSSKKALLNKWWETNTHLVYSDVQDASDYIVIINSKSKPIDSVNKPYSDQFKGKVLLEEVV